MRKRELIVDTLRERVVSARRFGTLGVEGRLPSARTLAAELDVDPRVVVAAYRGLEREGLVEQRPPSRAFFVAGHTPTRVPTPRSPETGGDSNGDAHPVEWLADVLAQAVERDIPVPTFPELAWRVTDTLRLRAVCVAGNRDHVTWLCRELQEDYGLDALGIDADALPDADARRGVPLALRRADLLVTVPTHAAAVTALAERLGRPCLVVAQRDDLVREVDRLLAAGPVHFVGTDPRFAAAVRAQCAGRCDPSHVRPVILDDEPTRAAAQAAALPVGAPAYVMRTARDRLGGVPPQVRVLATLRAFSRETRLTILRLVVARNLAAAAAASPHALPDASPDGTPRRASVGAPDARR